MRLQHLVAEVNRPLKKINYPGMCGDHRLCLNRKGQQPERTDTTVKHKNLHDCMETTIRLFHVAVKPSAARPAVSEDLRPQPKRVQPWGLIAGIRIGSGNEGHFRVGKSCSG